jgi:hypothetical protein
MGRGLTLRHRSACAWWLYFDSFFDRGGGGIRFSIGGSTPHVRPVRLVAKNALARCSPLISERPTHSTTLSSSSCIRSYSPRISLHALLL